MVGCDLHQYFGFLSWSNNDIRESHSGNADRHLASQPQGNLYLNGAVVGKAKKFIEAFRSTQWPETTYIEIQIHARFIAQHLHLDSGDTFVDLCCGQGLVLGIFHVLPVIWNHHFPFRLAVADVPELKILFCFALQEVHLLRVHRYRLEVERQIGCSAFRHPEE